MERLRPDQGQRGALAADQRLAGSLCRVQGAKMAVSVKRGAVLFVDVLAIRTLLLGVYIGATEFWKLQNRGHPLSSSVAAFLYMLGAPG